MALQTHLVESSCSRLRSHRHAGYHGSHVIAPLLLSSHVLRIRLGMSGALTRSR